MTTEREQIIEQLRPFMERGSDVREWPTEEAAAYREHRWAEGREAALQVRMASLFDQVIAPLLATARRETAEKAWEAGWWARPNARMINPEPGERNPFRGASGD